MSLTVFSGSVIFRAFAIDLENTIAVLAALLRATLMVQALHCALTMIRITTSATDDGLTVSIEGQLTEGALARVPEADELLASQDHLRLDLSELQYADHAGAIFLRKLIADGAEMIACSGFVEELLASESKQIDANPEADFVCRLRAGDDRAFEELVRRFGGRMISVARRFLTSEDDARDAVQEAFAAAFQSINRFNGTAMLSTWLHRIVVNAALMQLRRRRRKPEDSIDELLPRFDAEGAWAGDFAATGSTSHELIEERETREMVRRCISKLPDSYRAVLLLRDIEELDTAETALHLGIPASSVKVRLHRARQALRTLIEHQAGSGRTNTGALTASAA